MSRKKFHVKKGDQVEVISGAHKGATGIVLQVNVKKEHVLVEGVHIIKKHQKKSQEFPEGRIIEREGPLHISNVKLLEAKPASKAHTKKTKAA